MTHHQVTGPFDVNIAPQSLSPVAETTALQRLSLDKHYRGALEAASQGEMLAWRTVDKTSGGYVALEQVSGTLEGHSGSFVLQHSTTMSQGVPEQSIRVVPGSATGELAGLSGNMTVEIAADGQHAYRFDFELPDRP